jgi:hypothetical protein
MCIADANWKEEEESTLWALHTTIDHQKYIAQKKGKKKTILKF